MLHLAAPESQQAHRNLPKATKFLLVPTSGAHLAAREPPLRSLSAALHDMRYSFAPVGCRLALASLRKLLRDGAGENAAVLDGLVLCTAWPIEAKELGGSAREEEGLYQHAPGCGHFAYPADQRPTVRLWLAHTAQTCMTQVLAGQPWY
ncbi:hypothetical protein B0H13DRAFT_2342404 [Mycena leptocephala]|nr:hypothetical protein B0H13DRAFT_2342404 [Mycena leptocephala]